MDEALAQLTREWLTKAWHDLQTARIIAGAADGPLDTAIYHCQQAAEKSVKGWLAASSIPFEKTHDVRRLIQQAAGAHLDFNLGAPSRAAASRISRTVGLREGTISAMRSSSLEKDTSSGGAASRLRSRS